MKPAAAHVAPEVTEITVVISDWLETLWPAT
jgi:hypothetical protein